MWKVLDRGGRCSTNSGLFCVARRLHKKAHWWTVGSSVQWGSGCWTPSLKVQQPISVQENRWLRCIMGGRKESDTECVAWLRRTKRAAHSLRCKLGFPALWHNALAAIHGFAPDA